MNAFVLSCGLLVLGAQPPVPGAPKTLSPDQVKELVTKLEQPIAPEMQKKQGVLAGVGQNIHQQTLGVIRALAVSPETSRSAVLALLEDKKKPDHVRAYAAYIAMEWLLGGGAKQVVDVKLLLALRSALIETESCALKWTVLDRASGYGAAAVADRCLRNIPKEVLDVDPDTLCLSDDAMDGLLPAVIRLLSDSEPVVVAEAANVIWAFGRPKKGVKELLLLLTHQETTVRVAAVGALDRVGKGDAAVLRAIMEQLKGEYLNPKCSPQLLGALITVLEGFGPEAKEAVPALMAVLKEPRWRGPDCVHRRALLSLGKIGASAKDAIPVILEYLNDPKTGGGGELEVGVETLKRIDPEAGEKGAGIKKRRDEEFRRHYDRSPVEISFPSTLYLFF